MSSWYNHSLFICVCYIAIDDLDDASIGLTYMSDSVLPSACSPVQLINAIAMLMLLLLLLLLLLMLWLLPCCRCSCKACALGCLHMAMTCNWWLSCRC